MKAYLSGAMEYEADEGKSWRAEVESWLRTNLGHTAFNPVTETERLAGIEDVRDYRQWKQTDIQRYRHFVRQFVDHDLGAVRNDCDYLICYWNQATSRGGGTHGEITVAYLSGKPVYLICEPPPEEISGWILACASVIFRSFAELKIFLMSSYSPPGRH
ncbi:MAG: hypothetical protein ABIA75_04125 [Candidatus Neomarinimicrobiota bacterium]